MTIKNYPVVTEHNEVCFMDKRELFTTRKNVNDEIVLTAPLKLNCVLDLIGLTQTPEQLRNDFMRESDIIGNNVSIKNLYVLEDSVISKVAITAISPTPVRFTEGKETQQKVVEFNTVINSVATRIRGDIYPTTGRTVITCTNENVVGIDLNYYLVKTN